MRLRLALRALYVLCGLGVSLLLVHQTHGIGTSVEEHIASLPAPTSITKSPSKRPDWSFTEDEVRWLSLNAYFEARGEGDVGMAAVTWVVLNRMRNARFPNSPVHVIKEGGEKPGCQFSWWCDGKPDRPKNAVMFARVEQIVQTVLSGEVKDPTGGAVFYINPKRIADVGGVIPDIACDQTFTKRVGKHLFYGILPWDKYLKLCKGKEKSIVADILVASR